MYVKYKDPWEVHEFILDGVNKRRGLWIRVFLVGDLRPKDKQSPADLAPKTNTALHICNISGRGVGSLGEQSSDLPLLDCELSSFPLSRREQRECINGGSSSSSRRNHPPLPPLPPEASGARALHLRRRWQFRQRSRETSPAARVEGAASLSDATTALSASSIAVSN